MVLLTLNRVMDNEAWRVRVQFLLETKIFLEKREYVVHFVFARIYRLIFLNDSTFL